MSQGVRIALEGNATAFGYSVVITASFGATQLQRGQPGLEDLLLFGVGAVLAFTALEGLLTNGFKKPLTAGSSEVIALGTALSFVSVVVAIAAAHAVASVLSGGFAWFASALAASLAFVLTESVELVLAGVVQERRGEPKEKS
ncbi:MAG: hypothetical protein ACR2HC_04950 [Thermoleophilaceae bacterium]